MNQNDITEAEFTEVTDETTVEAVAEATEEHDHDHDHSHVAYSRADALKALTNSFHDGAITGAQLRDIRARLGITQSYFTGKKVTETQRKAKRKSQKAARKVNRKK